MNHMQHTIMLVTALATSTALAGGLERSWTCPGGGAFDHAGRVRVERMDDFDMTRTIFGALEGVPKMFMEEKLAKEPVWSGPATASTTWSSTATSDWW